MGNCICTTPSNPNTTSQQEDQEYSKIHVRRIDYKQKRANSNKVEELEEGERCREGIERRVEFEPKEGEKRVRIKVVLTQQELKQILEYHNGNSNYTSMEELLRSMRRSSRRSSRDSCRSSGKKSGWRPALHTIPEDT